MLAGMAGEKKRKQGQISVYVNEPLRALIEKFRAEYPHFTESQIGGRALSYYIQEVLARGLDPLGPFVSWGYSSIGFCRLGTFGGLLGCLKDPFIPILRRIRQSLDSQCIPAFSLYVLYVDLPFQINWSSKPSTLRHPDT